MRCQGSWRLQMWHRRTASPCDLPGKQPSTATVPLLPCWHADWLVASSFSGCMHNSCMQASCPLRCHWCRRLWQQQETPGCRWCWTACRAATWCCTCASVVARRTWTSWTSQSPLQVNLAPDPKLGRVQHRQMRGSMRATGHVALATLADGRWHFSEALHALEAPPCSPNVRGPLRVMRAAQLWDPLARAARGRLPGLLFQGSCLCCRLAPSILQIILPPWVPSLPLSDSG